jgi:hypothetical protein
MPIGQNRVIKLIQQAKPLLIGLDKAPFGLTPVGKLGVNGHG